MDLIVEGPWLARRAERSPGREALRFEGRSWSYAELDAGARRRARALRRAGVRRGDVVAVLLAPSPACLELLHAMIACGAVLLPLNARLRPPELAFQMTDAGARWLVGETGPTGDLARQALAAGGSARLLDLAELDDGPEVELDRPLDPASDFAVLYTSGTTGRPKGAVLSHGHFLCSALASAERLGVDPEDRWLACLPLFHVGGLAIAIRSAITGTSILLHPGFDARRVDRDLDAERPTLASFVATMLRRVLDVRGDRPAPRSLRAVLVGGGPTPVALLARARAAGFPVAPTYGLTEAASQVATRDPADDAPPLDGRLRPLPGTEVRVVGDDGRPLAPGEVGEIQVRGPTVMRGYLSRPAETAAALGGGWLHTGDLGRLDRDGLLSVLDRRSDLIVSGGENVYPAEVEAALLAHPGVAEAAVAGRPDDEFGARPMAWWVADPCGPLADASDPEAAERLRAHCRERLAGYKVPVAFVRRDVLPRNATGKLLRRSLEADSG